MADGDASPVAALSFEAALQELEQVVARLESGQVPLEESIALYARGAELIGWKNRNPRAGATRQGRYLTGIGMATATYPVHNNQGTARVRLYADGRALVQSGATDLGTGTYTVMTQVAADTLGLTPDKVRFELGDSRLPTAPNSGGSVAGGTVSSSV